MKIMAAKLRKEFFELIKDCDIESALVNDVTLLNILNNPEWEMAGSVCEWRRFVPKSLKEMWTNLTINERALIYLFTKHISEMIDD